MTWHKQTQSFSSSDNFFKILWNNALNDEASWKMVKRRGAITKTFKFNSQDFQAFTILDLPAGLGWKKIQQRFKKLVKKFQPDMNAGNKKFEDKLKVITLAYTQLKNTYKVKIDN